MEPKFIERKILRKYGNLSPSAILRCFTEDAFIQALLEDTPWTFVIIGRNGPTGKSWLCRGLQNRGFTAVELTESICQLVDYRDSHNHVIADYCNKTIVIVLNRSLRDEV
jgi:hypothetical protein